MNKELEEKLLSEDDEVLKAIGKSLSRTKKELERIRGEKGDDLDE